ncbi:MAG: sugar ABC transporter permease [Chloroflexi bacterium]|nr:sugar ABC transporter permease [Chloroflexota bacterium]
MIKLTDRRFVLLLLAPAGCFLVIFVAYPLLLLLRNSFYEVSLYALNDGVYVGWDNFVKALSSPRVRESAGRTLNYTLIALSAEFVLGFGAALLFNALGKRSEILRTIFAFPLMIPPIVAGLLWRFMLIDNIGIVNHILETLGIIGDASDISWLGDRDLVLFSVALPNIWLTTSFVALVLYTGLQNIPAELIEAAKIDGANNWQRFHRVTVPLLRPVIAVVLILRGIDAARAFDMIWIQTEGGPRFASEILSIHIYRAMIRYGNVGEASAIATLFMLGMVLASALAFYVIWGRGSSQS